LTFTRSGRQMATRRGTAPGRTTRGGRSGYVNFIDGDLGDERVRAAYGANYSRLAEVKAAYDPDNFFRFNHNIAPAVAVR